MYAYLGGIKPDAEYPGFKRFVIEPRPVGDLNWVKAEYESPYGRIVSNWELKDGQFIVNVSVPPNTRAKVVLPAKNTQSVTGNRGTLLELPQAIIIKEKDHLISFWLDAGSYRFVSHLK